MSDDVIGGRYRVVRRLGGGTYGRVVEAVAEDLNTAGAIAELHRLAHEGDAQALKASAAFLGLLTEELGGWDEAAVDLSALAETLAQLRDDALASKDFSAVDAMKHALAEAGVEVRMSKQGVELLPGRGFDASKLGAL